MARHSTSIVGGVVATGAGVGVWSTSASSIPANKSIVEMSVGYESTSTSTGSLGGRFSVGLWNGAALYLAQFVMPELVFNAAGAAATWYTPQTSWKYPPLSFRLANIPGGFLLGNSTWFLAARLDSATAQSMAPNIYIDVIYED